MNLARIFECQRKNNDMSYDSKEELHFSWYLNELKKIGFVEEWQYQKPCFNLTRGENNVNKAHKMV